MSGGPPQLLQSREHQGNSRTSGFRSSPSLHVPVPARKGVLGTRPHPQTPESPQTHGGWSCGKFPPLHQVPQFWQKELGMKKERGSHPHKSPSAALISQSPELRTRDGQGAGSGSARKPGAPSCGLSGWQGVRQVPPRVLGKSLEVGGGWGGGRTGEQTA